MSNEMPTRKVSKGPFADFQRSTKRNIEFFSDCAIVRGCLRIIREAVFLFSFEAFRISFQGNKIGKEFVPLTIIGLWNEA